MLGVEDDGRVVTASNVNGSVDDNEDSGDDNEEDSSEDEDGDCIGRRNSTGGRKTRSMYFPRDSVEESEDDDSCTEAETMLLAIVLSMSSRQIRCRHQPKLPTAPGIRLRSP
jgi:hypothetical protein